MVFDAVAGEVLPDLRREGQLGFVVVGFTVGVAVLLVAVGLDLLILGLLTAVGAIGGAALLGGASPAARPHHRHRRQVWVADLAGRP